MREDKIILNLLTLEHLVGIPRLDEKEERRSSLILRFSFYCGSDICGHVATGSSVSNAGL